MKKIGKRLVYFVVTPCLVCGVDVEHPRGTVQKYCSDKCRKERNESNKRASTARSN